MATRTIKTASFEIAFKTKAAAETFLISWAKNYYGDVSYAQEMIDALSQHDDGTWSWGCDGLEMSECACNANAEAQYDDARGVIFAKCNEYSYEV